jgi:hypothetical protein
MTLDIITLVIMTLGIMTFTKWHWAK